MKSERNYVITTEVTAQAVDSHRTLSAAVEDADHLAKDGKTVLIYELAGTFANHRINPSPPDKVGSIREHPEFIAMLEAYTGSLKARQGLEREVKSLKTQFEAMKENRRQIAILSNVRIMELEEGNASDGPIIDAELPF